MSSSCFGSLDIRRPGGFAETFLDHYHFDICKSNAKTHKIISINRLGITCYCFSSRNIPAIALFASTFLSSLDLSRSNQCFGCGLDQSHCRKVHIQIWLWPGLVAYTTQLSISIHHTGNSFLHQHIPRKRLRASSCWSIFADLNRPLSKKNLPIKIHYRYKLNIDRRR